MNSAPNDSEQGDLCVAIIFRLAFLHVQICFRDQF